jgi:membrane-bound serine protease (ClpP class)
VRKVFVYLVLAAIVGAICASSVLAAGDRPVVDSIRIEGPIDPAVALYVHRGIAIAEESHAVAVMILLETPGGLDDSMRSIIKDILQSTVPVIVYVWPEGARAASAGAIITMAAQIAAMSPSTAIGAAHPVSMGGGEPDATMAKKIENDAAAYVRSIAYLRGRNVKLSESIVRQSVSESAEEAKKLGIIDVIASNQQDLLRQINGRSVRVSSGVITLYTRDAEIVPIDPSMRERFLHVIDNPNFAYILMLIAIYGIIFELSNPGSIFPGVIGGISLILALFSFAVLPVNLAGVLLILFAVGLLITDLFLPSHGVLTVGGLAAFVVGSLILFETGSSVFRISATLVVTMAVLTAAFFLLAIGAGIRAQKARVVTGKQGMIGEVAQARTDIDPTGKVFADGAWWNARTQGAPIRKGEPVRIVGMERLVLLVTKEMPQDDEAS